MKEVAGILVRSYVISTKPLQQRFAYFPSNIERAAVMKVGDLKKDFFDSGNISRFD